MSLNVNTLVGYSGFRNQIVVIVSFVPLFAIENKALGMQKLPIALVSQGKRLTFSQYIFPNTCLLGRSEQKFASRIECSGNLRNGSDLNIGRQQEHQSPGDHGVKCPPEKFRVFDRRAFGVSIGK